ncbi:MAG: hypothetical protein AB2A00_15550 [Myxococcota bacterium]
MKFAAAPGRSLGSNASATHPPVEDVTEADVLPDAPLVDDVLVDDVPLVDVVPEELEDEDVFEELEPVLALLDMEPDEGGPLHAAAAPSTTTPTILIMEPPSAKTTFPRVAKAGTPADHRPQRHCKLCSDARPPVANAVGGST